MVKIRTLGCVLSRVIGRALGREDNRDSDEAHVRVSEDGRAGDNAYKNDSVVS